MINKDKRGEIVSEALTWVGTPYHHMGKVKGAGVDCGQILISVYSSVGLIEDYETDYYPFDWALHRSEEKYLENIMRYAQPTNNPKVGDIAVYKFGRCVSHSGIIINEREIVHAWLKAKQVTISRMDEGELNGRLHGYYTLFKEDE